MATDKTNSPELPHPIHNISYINDKAQDKSLFSDTSKSNPLSSQFSSPTPPQIAKKPFNPPQEPVTNTERLL